MKELQIPVEIPTQNVTERGRTWRARAAATKKRRAAWRTLCSRKMMIEGVAPAEGPRSIHIIAYRSQRCKDIANLIGGAKACIDGLVDARLLLDDQDSMASITYEPRVASTSPTTRPHTTIQIIKD